MIRVSEYIFRLLLLLKRLFRLHVSFNTGTAHWEELNTDSFITDTLKSHKSANLKTLHACRHATPGYKKPICCKNAKPYNKTMDDEK